MVLLGNTGIRHLPLASQLSHHPKANCPSLVKPLARFTALSSDKISLVKVKMSWLELMMLWSENILLSRPNDKNVSLQASKAVFPNKVLATSINTLLLASSSLNVSSLQSNWELTKSNKLNDSNPFTFLLSSDFIRSPSFLVIISPLKPSKMMFMEVERNESALAPGSNSEESHFISLGKCSTFARPSVAMKKAASSANVESMAALTLPKTLTSSLSRSLLHPSTMAGSDGVSRDLITAVGS